MRHRKVLLFSNDPGGVNTLIPLIHPLKAKGWKVALFGMKVALERYSKAGLSGFDIMDFIGKVDLKQIEKFLLKENPCLVITGTSTGSDFTEKYLWKTCENLGVPSMAILDQWINYGIRFSEYSLSEIKDFNNDKTCAFLPSRILVMDDYARQEAIKDNLDSSVIVVTGQPHFEALLKEKNKISKEKLKKLRKQLDAGERDFIITFASEPLSRDYGVFGGNTGYWGYTEQTVFKELLDGLKTVSLECRKNILVVLRLHPREDEMSYKNILASLGLEEKIKFLIDKKLNAVELISVSNLICGMSSMFLIESVILGKPVISIQIGLKRENPFILNKRGVLKSVTDKKGLQKSLRRIIIKNSYKVCKFDFIKNPVENVIFQAEKLLCQN